MRFRLFFYGALTLCIGGLGIFFLMSESYQASLTAKYHYMTGDYQQAYKEAKAAYEQDPYNRMASTVMAHSMLAIDYLNYIKEGKAYRKKIDSISQKPYIERSDRLRIKFMAEIMVERYDKLSRSVVIDDALKQEATTMYMSFKAVHAKILSSL